jgi:NifB/MoaA-like Fe-S oxidoreductase
MAMPLQVPLTTETATLRPVHTTWLRTRPQPGVRRTGLTISSVDPHGPGAELGLQPGDVLLAINGHPLRDVIDYRFYCADGDVTITVARGEQEFTLHADLDGVESLYVSFVEPFPDGIRVCHNDCPFCFVYQNPKGRRRTLYIKDDDYRYSFYFGHFVTLTNLTEEDWQRIAEQRLSPLHVSVHATDLELRRFLLGYPHAPDVLAQIRRLGSIGVQVHTQIVLCPGYNDGPALDKSIADLLALWPIVRSISIVPVGLTKYQRHLDGGPAALAGQAIGDPLYPANSHGRFLPGGHGKLRLRRVTPQEAAQLLERLEPLQRRLRRTYGLTLVYPSDELYLLAGAPLPPESWYDGYAQFENGVGTTRWLLQEWARVRRRLPPAVPQPLHVRLVCGELIAPVLQQLGRELAGIRGLSVEVVPVKNEWLGDSVNVSGLLAGADVLRVLRSLPPADVTFLPRRMFDEDGRITLDDVTFEEIAAAVPGRVELAQSMGEVLRALLPHGARARRSAGTTVPVGISTLAGRLSHYAVEP